MSYVRTLIFVTCPRLGGNGGPPVKHASAAASCLAPITVLLIAGRRQVCGSRGVGEARAIGGCLAGLPALLHCVKAGLRAVRPAVFVPRIVAAGVPAVAHTQSNGPRGSRRGRGRGRWRARQDRKGQGRGALGYCLHASHQGERRDEEHRCLHCVGTLSICAPRRSRISDGAVRAVILCRACGAELVVQSGRWRRRSAAESARRAPSLVVR